MELYKASKQWSERPADERFWNLKELHDACKAYRMQAASSEVLYNDLRVESVDGEMFLTGRTGQHARLTNWSFGQMAQRAGAPAGYLRKLPATLAAQNVNHGLKSRSDADKAKLLLHVNGDLVLRGMTGPQYNRIWNYEVADKLMQLADWKTPPAYANSKSGKTKIATPEDCLPGLSRVTPGTVIGPAGIYASDHDMFVFLVDPSKPIEVDGQVLYRGVFFWNSEVGAKSIGGTTFLFNAICGNHIVWGAKNVREFRFRHVGSARGRAFRKMRVELREYANESVSDQAAKIKAAKNYVLGANKEEIMDTVFRYAARRKIASKPMLEAAYDVAVKREDRYGAPNTAWAISNGMSEYSQTLTGDFADKRLDVDRAAGKLMEIAF